MFSWSKSFQKLELGILLVNSVSHLTGKMCNLQVESSHFLLLLCIFLKLLVSPGPYLPMDEQISDRS